MTLTKPWTIGIAVALALIVALGGYEFLQEHDARIKAESTQSIQEGVIRSTQVSIDKAKSDQAQTAVDLKAQLAAIANQRTIIVTPQQAAQAIPTFIPNLPQPVQVQAVAATPTAPATQQLVIPQADLPAFQAYKLSCDESGARLMACSKDAISYEAEMKAGQDQFAAIAKERDSWKSAAQGGTLIHRTITAAKWIVIGAGVGYAAGHKF